MLALENASALLQQVLGGLDIYSSTSSAKELLKLNYSLERRYDECRRLY